jgi:hypothetical protein
MNNMMKTNHIEFGFLKINNRLNFAAPNDQPMKKWNLFKKKVGKNEDTSSRRGTQDCDHVHSRLP